MLLIVKEPIHESSPKLLLTSQDVRRCVDFVTRLCPYANKLRRRESSGVDILSWLIVNVVFNGIL